MRLALILVAAAVFAGAPVQAAPPAASPPRDETDPQAKRITGSDTYVPTFGLRASIARGFKVHGVLAVDAGLDVPDQKTVKKVEAMKPRIMSTMREAVLSYASLSYVVGERPDADMLRARLQKAVDQIMGKDTVKVALASVIVFKDGR
jgi:flagellar basal body-associated protein FliL